MLLLVDDCIGRTDIDAARRIRIPLTHVAKFGHAEGDVLGHRWTGFAVHLVGFSGVVDGVGGAFVDAGVAIDAIIRDNDHFRYLS